MYTMNCNLLVWYNQSFYSMLYYLLKIYHMIPNFLNHVSNIWHHFQHTQHKKQNNEWKKNCIQSNSFRKEEIRVIAIVAPLTLVSKNDRFVNISLLTDGIRFVHTYINSPETTSWYHHHHKKMTRCQVSTFKSVKKIWYSLCSVESIFMLISTCLEQEEAKRSPEAVDNWKKIF